MAGDHLPEQMDQSVVTTGAKGTVAEDLEESAAKVPATAGTPKDLEAKVEGLNTDVNDSTTFCLRSIAAINRLRQRSLKPPGAVQHHLGKIVHPLLNYHHLVEGHSNPPRG